MYQSWDKYVPIRRLPVEGSPNLIITRHAAVRARQRGFRPADLAMVESLGSFAGDGILLRKADVEPEIKRLIEQRRVIRRQVAAGALDPAEAEKSDDETGRTIERLRRIEGTYIPSEDGHAVSVYRPCKQKLKRLLQRHRPRRTKRR
jgi:hypothetical protein